MGGSASKNGNKGSEAGDVPILDDDRPRFQQELIKVCIVGGTGCGKTKILRRIVHNAFHDKPGQHKKQAMRHRPTERISVGTRTVRCRDGDVITIEFWDRPTASSFDFSGPFFADADAVILCVDLTDRFSTDAVPRSVAEICDRLQISNVAQDIAAAAALAPEAPAGGAGGAGGNAHALDGTGRETLSVPVILIGTKGDGRTRVTRKETTSLAAEQGLLGPVHVSALEDTGVSEVIALLRDHFVKNPKLYRTRAEAYRAGLEAAQDILSGGGGGGGGGDDSAAGAQDADDVGGKGEDKKKSKKDKEKGEENTKAEKAEDGDKGKDAGDKGEDAPGGTDGEKGSDAGNGGGVGGKDGDGDASHTGADTDEQRAQQAQPAEQAPGETPPPEKEDPSADGGPGGANQEGGDDEGPAPARATEGAETKGENGSEKDGNDVNSRGNDDDQKSPAQGTDAIAEGQTPAQKPPALISDEGENANVGAGGEE